MKKFYTEKLSENRTASSERVWWGCNDEKTRLEWLRFYLGGLKTGKFGLWIVPRGKAKYMSKRKLNKICFISLALWLHASICVGWKVVFIHFPMENVSYWTPHDGLQNNELTLNSYSRSDSRRTFKPKTEMNSFCVQMCEDLIWSHKKLTAPKNCLVTPWQPMLPTPQ